MVVSVLKHVLPKQGDKCNVHQNEFFKEKESLAKTQVTELNSALNHLQNFDMELLTQVESLIEEYKKKYGVSVRHIADSYNVYQQYL